MLFDASECVCSLGALDDDLKRENCAVSSKNTHRWVLLSVLEDKAI